MLRAAASALVAVACLAAPGVSHAQPAITIRIFDSTERSAKERSDAIASAAAIFAEAGLTITWRDCGRNGADYPCAGTRLAQDLVVRIVPRAVAPEAPASTAVTADTLRLGFAAAPSRGHGGTLATVYAEPVRRVTERTGVPFALLLGRAIAHEVGHLLPDPSRAGSQGGHTATGLMRAVWTDDQLRRGRAEDWVYFADVPPVRTTRSSGTTVDDSNGVVPVGAPLD